MDLMAWTVVAIIVGSLAMWFGYMEKHDLEIRCGIFEQV